MGARAESIHELLGRIARLLEAEGRRAGRGLLPAQLQALAYLNRCNRYSDTPAAVADYLGTTRGTASQTIRALERRGLLVRHRDAADRRRFHLRPTTRGRRLARLALGPAVLAEALARLGPGGPGRLEASLRDLLRALQRAHGGVAFGVCETCRHLRDEGAGRARCGLTLEPLARSDRALLCREHEAAA